MEALPNPSIVLTTSTDDASSVRQSPAFSEDTFITIHSTSTRASSIVGLPDRPITSGPRLLGEVGSSSARSSPLLGSSVNGDVPPLLKSTKSHSAVEKLRADRADECGEDLSTPTAGNEVSKEAKKLRAESGDGLGTEGTEGLGSPSQPEVMEAPSCSIEDSGLSRGQKVGNDKKENGEGGETSGFDRFKLPTKDELRAAGICLLADENGRNVTFDSLVQARGKVVVVFLRHLWCGLCAQYVVALKSATENLAQASTSQLSTESMYTPPPLYILLKTLGMTLKTLSLGKEEDKGSYVTKSNLGNVIDSARNGLAMRRYPGSQKQLGGEFVMVWNDETGQMECTYASRMNSTRSHSEVRDLFSAAGVHLDSIDEASIFSESQHEGL
ncbi:BZ3500_MvSof-1268-A1-R1_Chr12-1g03658 [Microbotryum saponariae]|uniref:BZ3500_MvSof-1268-A1-R1_Chr12-1g03658 protein n=1 Tax=Microbotryum saponariae TaxID=289078 RepID=A0A2X0LEF4_9BASI|nr:BZ3500_MvSof-1268-A1-R1_Chr12-1g03658 [Microbotryum saponariae]SDA05251.1 BZ3501_MvSof-1269-A2-R1_Chr12-1g03235 [Microbotryum saponariae]